MAHRSFFASLVLVLVIALGGACADLMGMLTVRAGQPVGTVAPRPAAAVVPQPVAAQQPAAAQQPTGPDHVVVESVTVGETELVVSGSTPIPRIRVQTPSGDETSTVLVSAEWCLLDANLSGLCVLDAENSPNLTPAGSFQYRLRYQDAELTSSIVVRRDETQVADLLTVSTYVRLLWFDRGEVEVQPTGARGQHLSIQPGTEGWTAGPDLSPLECLWPDREEWVPCTDSFRLHTSLLIKVDDAVGDAMTASLSAVMPKDAYYAAFPSAPGFCEWASRDVVRLTAEVDNILAGEAAEDMFALAASARDLVWAWNQQQGLVDSINPAGTPRCGESDGVGDVAQLAGQKLLELMGTAAPMVIVPELEQWASVACAGAPDLCEEFNAVVEEQREFAAASDELEIQLASLEDSCAPCVEAVEYDERSLNYDCYENIIDEACRRLQRIVQNRCSDSCGPLKRCRECLNDLEDEVGSVALDRLAGDRCHRACR